jgi:hypothetical protein
MVKYIDDIINIKPDMIVDRPLWYHKRGLMQTATGYGRKLVTSKMLKIGNRLHRIYCCIFSNCGTCYVIYNGEEFSLKYDNYEN